MLQNVAFHLQFHAHQLLGFAGGGAVDEPKKVLITNDAIVFGILVIMLATIFYLSNLQNRFLKIFFKVVPMLLLCYFLPSLLTTFRVVDPEQSKLYYVASRFLLPASLVLLTMSIDLKEILRLGPKALIMFLTGTVGVMIGGPLAIFMTSFFAPDVVGGNGPEAIWRGFSTVAGSWIGGGANQASMYEIFRPEKAAEGTAGGKKYDQMYSVMITLDVIVAEIWMVFLLIGVGFSKHIDRFFNADASAIENLKEKMEKFSKSTARNPTAVDLMVLAGICFGITGLGHLVGDAIGPFVKENYPFLKRFSLNSEFFWLIIIATTLGLILSFTKLRNYEGVGASKIGTVFIFILVATIGMKMDITVIAQNWKLFIVGGIWMFIHVGLLFLVGWLIRAPYFYLAVGSKANIGGAASAPVVAAAFHPSLAPVGVLLAVLGYALGTYCALLCAYMMEAAAPT